MHNYKRIERRNLPDEVGSKEVFFFFGNIYEVPSSVHHTHTFSINKLNWYKNICSYPTPVLLPGKSHG